MMAGSDYGTKLTHEHLYEIARRLTSKYDIRPLGLKLGVKPHRMDTIFWNKNGDITEAAYEILREWRKGQPDAVTAFITLRDALTHPDVNLHQAAQEALNNDLDWIYDLLRRIDAGIIMNETKLEGCRPEDTNTWKNLRSQYGKSCYYRAMTDAVLEELSKRLSADDMKRLATQLGISQQEVDTSFNTQKPIHDILKNWLKRQDNRHAAYITMGEALIRAGLNLIATEVLNYPPVEGGNTFKSGGKRRRQRTRDKNQRKKLKKMNGFSVRP